jgi:hypothetical protein
MAGLKAVLAIRGRLEVLMKVITCYLEKNSKHPLPSSEYHNVMRDFPQSNILNMILRVYRAMVDTIKFFDPFYVRYQRMVKKIHSTAIVVGHFDFALDSPLAIIPLFNNE